MARKQYCIRIDEVIWDKAKLRIGKMSPFIEQQLELVNNSSNEIALLEKELYETEQKAMGLRARLCSLKEDSVEIHKDEMDNAIETLNRVNKAHGFVGANKIKDIASLHGLSESDLLEYCKGENIIIRKYFEPNSEKVRNPVTGKF